MEMDAAVSFCGGSVHFATGRLPTTIWAIFFFAGCREIPAMLRCLGCRTDRRPFQKKGAKDAIHMVSAFAARQRLVLEQVKVAKNRMKSSPS